MSEARVAGAYWCFPSIASLKDTVRNMCTGEGRRGRRMEDRGREGWTEGRRTYLYTGRVAQNAVLGSNAVSFIFSQEAHSNFPIGVSPYYYYFRVGISNRNLWIFIFRFSMPNSDSYNATSRQLLFIERGATMAPSYKSILAFPNHPYRSGRQLVPGDHLCYRPFLSPLSRRNLAFQCWIPLYRPVPLVCIRIQ